MWINPNMVLKHCSTPRWQWLCANITEFVLSEKYELPLTNDRHDIMGLELNNPLTKINAFSYRRLLFISDDLVQIYSYSIALEGFILLIAYDLSYRCKSKKIVYKNTLFNSSFVQQTTWVILPFTDSFYASESQRQVVHTIVGLRLAVSCNLSKDIFV